MSQSCATSCNLTVAPLLLLRHNYVQMLVMRGEKKAPKERVREEEQTKSRREGKKRSRERAKALECIVCHVGKEYSSLSSREML